MTDRELLENAAKAAGIEIYESTDGTIQNRTVWVFRAGGGMGTMPYEEQWNPLREDAQAFRLGMLVKQVLKIELKTNHVNVIEDESGLVITEDYNGDPYAATRRAIVRAAAEIGKNL